jgi:hypothetical protein
MLQCERQNYHHRKIPNPGTIGIIQGLEQSGIDSKRKCIVIAYPLTDGAIWKRRAMSVGIHSIHVRFLDNSEIKQFSAMWFEEIS